MMQPFRVGDVVYWCPLPEIPALYPADPVVPPEPRQCTVLSVAGPKVTLQRVGGDGGVTLEAPAGRLAYTPHEAFERARTDAIHVTIAQVRRIVADLDVLTRLRQGV